MIYNLNRKTKVRIAIIAITTALIPIGITFFELITTEKESVVFLENYPTPISTLVLLYYILLIILGAAWFITQIISLFKLKNEKAKAELQHLKSQVNPHFFFNTLNNLYGLVGKDVQKAQKLILKLSELMRYSIYQGEREFVNLSEEVDYLTNYIELHRMRYRKEIDVQFEIDMDEDHKIMPLLFIILLENAFKHGIENLPTDAYIHLSIQSQNNEVFFEIENNFDTLQEKRDQGIGLKNLKRRLELMYPHNHTLTLSTEKNVYSAQLTLQL
ncbi:MAG: histidine kinase [Saprospiraceae bacterium]|nr:histidine kinase [Saprospiraceae bacterium]